MTNTLTTLWLCPDQVFDGDQLYTEVAVEISNRKVVSLKSLSNLPVTAKISRVSGTITPGYLDLQVNGGGGVLLNNDPTVAGIQAIVAAHRHFGTVGLMATIITDAPEVLARSVAAVIAAQGTPGLLGLHIEGPHISIQKRGTHAAKFIRPLDSASIALIEQLRNANITVMMTVAPEAVQKGQISTLVGLGTIVSLGHSDADQAATQAALAEGASCFTHLFNAMSPMLGRAAGITGTAINSSAYCGIICDGHHVADEMIGLAIRARPATDRMFLVSDAMATVGGLNQFSLYGQKIRLINGRLVNNEGALAGAHITLAQSVARLISVLKIAPEAALRMAVTVPSLVLKRPDLAKLIGRNAEDVLILGADWMPEGTCDKYSAQTTC